MKKLTIFLTLILMVSACNKPVTTELKSTRANNAVVVQKNTETELEDAFWNALLQQCTHIFTGQSTFPDTPEDSFYGKNLVANFINCTDTKIHVPFHVGDNKSRTWIFSKLDNGKIQLKHQHLHADGSVDEVSNYGGTSIGGDIEINELSKTIHVHFPADDFTKQLIPEASTNVWTIELITHSYSNQDVLTYNLYRHGNKRFLAKLEKVQ